MLIFNGEVIAMSIEDRSLFASDIPIDIGIGFHNVGSGVLRASHESMVSYVERHYGERCGHFPFNAARLYALVEQDTPDIRSQMAYLSELFGKTITSVTLNELRVERERIGGSILVVPYINVPETETSMQEALGTQPWGLPGKLTDALKNKVNFYRLADEFQLVGFYPPDYTVVTLENLVPSAAKFLSCVEDIYQQAGMVQNYPLGLMMRAAESDGNYGCCLLYESAAGISLVPNGDPEHGAFYRDWQAALLSAQEHLAGTMNTEKENRVVISRYIDFVDSPGMSVVIMDGQVVSLGWNSQLQKEGSKACIGTSTYIPKSLQLERKRPLYEAQTMAYFETFLRETARLCGIDFASLRGVANIDVMIPAEPEQELQKRRKQPAGNYLAECNPRWTNYTDAIMAVLGANRKVQSIANMKTVIREGICTFDKYPLPEGVSLQVVRKYLAEKDAILKQDGTRIICRMAKNPMGLILAGDLKRAQQEVDAVLTSLAISM